MLEANIHNIKTKKSSERNIAPVVIIIGPARLRIEDVLAVATGSARIELDNSPAFRKMLERTVDLLDRHIENGTEIYGVTTGFGATCETAVPATLSAKMAANLVRFHGCGTGEILGDAEAAAVMVVRLASLAQGRSAVRPLLLERLCQLLNLRILPRIPCEGSVGASGDLTPLSYIAAVLIGEREVSFDNRVMPAADALDAAGIKPIQLRPKESLALMNGTSVMTGLACLAYERARRAARWAAAITAMASDVSARKSPSFRSAIVPRQAPPRPNRLRPLDRG